MVKRRYGKSKGGYRKKKMIRKRRVYRRKRFASTKSTGHYIECNVTKAMIKGTNTVEVGLQNRIRVFWGSISPAAANEITLDSSLEFQFWKNVYTKYKVVGCKMSWQPD